MKAVSVGGVTFMVKEDANVTDEAIQAGFKKLEGMSAEEINALPSMNEKAEIPVNLSEVSEQAKGAARDRFKALDKNGDGKLDIGEWKRYMGEFGLYASEAEIAFKAWDMDKSDGITVDEFEKVVADIEEVKKQAEAEVMNTLPDFGKMQRVLCFACCCCLCTAGLSCCPVMRMYAKTQAALTKKYGAMGAGDTDVLINNISVREVKTKLLKGPTGQEMGRT
eukprot:CAMPEP_0174721682 /NCGR_PEP_ID=MMETSP1094-20130205/36882_1 /TAXON_ID=156173 /ORGANISM="Chrysochromulina brevifilum, Strain UTEX LB 985" /LENGTH=221 /DNA_ID=CAMNT_0015922423 /DNA_START=39 /DNA_END=704 /DNA_ORIENTATION=-